MNKIIGNFFWRVIVFGINILIESIPFINGIIVLMTIAKHQISTLPRIFSYILQTFYVDFSEQEPDNNRINKENVPFTVKNLIPTHRRDELFSIQMHNLEAREGLTVQENKLKATFENWRDKVGGSFWKSNLSWQLNINVRTPLHERLFDVINLWTTKSLWWVLWEKMIDETINSTVEIVYEYRALD